MQSNSKIIQKILDNDYELPKNETIPSLTPILITALQATESIPRESALDILWTWILNGKYPNEALIALGNELTDIMQQGLGENHSDTVFGRAFAALILGTIIDFDEKCASGEVEGRTEFLIQIQVHSWFTQMEKYYLGERDYRGYIPVKEWGHSLAHGADLIRFFAQHRHLQDSDLKRLLDIIAQKLAQSAPMALKFHETKRIAVALYTIFLRKEISLEIIQNWLMTGSKKYIDERWTKFVNDVEINNARHNYETFLSNIYFLLKLGISENRSFAIPFYQNHSISNVPEILVCIEKIMHQMDHGVFFKSIEEN